MKRCRKCGVEKPLDSFHRSSRHSDGRQSYCKPCKSAIGIRHYEMSPGRRARIRESVAKGLDRSREVVRAYLLEHPCVDCGETDLVVLEFDHVRGVKGTEINRAVAHGWPLERLMAEIAKCDVVCSNDHRRRTARRNGRWWKSSLASIDGDAQVS